MGIRLLARSQSVAAVACLFASAVVLAGCDTTPPALPSTPVLASGEAFDGAGVRSVQQGFAVYVEKVDSPNSDIAALAQYGLPLKVVVANLSNAPIDFGLEHVVVKKGGAELALLDEQKIKDLKEAQQEDADNYADLMGGLAMIGGAMAPVAAQQGQMSAGQAAIIGMEAKMDVAQVQQDKAEADARISTEKDALVRANRGIMLTDDPIPAHGFTGGIVLVSGADPSDALEVDVTAGATRHVFTFVPDTSAPAPDTQ